MADEEKKGAEIREFLRLKPALRDDLEFSEHREGGKFTTVIHDPVRSQYYRIGRDELGFARALDGSRTVAEAADKAGGESDSGLSVNDCLLLAKWLVESGLAATERMGPEALHAASSAADSQRIIQRLNLIFVRIPLFNPDRVLKLMTPYFHWCFTKAAVTGWALCLLAGVFAVFSDPGRAAVTTVGTFSSNSWMLIGLAWVLLKLIHEAAHGIALTHYGQRVREFGVLFIMFIPVGYTDASAAWRLPSKWQRVAVASAGMYAELFIASLAALAWRLTGDENIMFLAFNVMIAASLSTVVFNMNPLMRFDGYYILSDLIESPNLYTNGVRYCSYLMRRYVMGLDAALPASVLRGRSSVIKVYGICAFFWRICVIATLLVSAGLLAPGIGPAIALIAAVLWFLPGAKRALAFFGPGTGLSIGKRIRSVAAVALLVAGLWLALTHIAWPGYVSSPGYVEYRDALVVRPGVGGFVKSVHLKHGDYAGEGDLVVELENRELTAALRKVELDLALVRLRSRIYYHAGDVAASQVEDQSAVALEKRKRELADDVDALRIVAEREGRIVAPELDSRLGSFVTPADALFTVASEDSKEVRFSIAQEDIQLARSRLGELGRVIMKEVGTRKIYARISRVEPEAKLGIPHPALGSVGGGPLPVRPKTSSVMQTGGLAAMTGHELMAARFTAVLELDESQSEALRAGQVCKVSMRSKAQTISDRLAIMFSRWVEQVRARRGK